MQLETWVLNLEDQPDRWDTMRRHLDGWGITDPKRFNAIPPVEGEVPVWRGRDRKNVPKRVAIVRTYARLMQTLEGRDADRFLVVQDDIRFTADPHRKFTHPLHLYGGYTIRPRGWGIYKEIHVHPWAFTIQRDFVRSLWQEWAEPVKPSCELWTRIIRPDTTTYDDPATATTGVTRGD